MATDIVGSLFGVSPEMYRQQMNRQAMQDAIELQKLKPSERYGAMLQAGAYQLGQGLGGAMGIEDPALQKLTAVNTIAKEIDFTDMNSINEGIKAISRIDPNSALRLQSYAADIVKKMQPPKLTGDERYISILQSAENIARAGQDVPAALLSNANIAAQMLAKPRTYFDEASGQMVTVPATDPSKAFPNVFKLFGGAPQAEAPQQAGALTPTTPTPGVPSTSQVTQGNLPAGSQKRLGEIDANLVKLGQSGPELQDFLTQIKEGKVKYNATSNVFDFLGAVVPPAFGFGEAGNQADKDKIDRALTERVNTLLLMAKGTQTEGDAQRAANQIASYSTKFSPQRMQGAIESLIKAEEKLKKELNAERTTLLGQGRPEAATRQPGAQITPRPASPAQAQPQQTSNEQRIQRFIEFNGGKPTREEAERILRSQGIIK